jgi:hypothetical protein
MGKRARNGGKGGDRRAKGGGAPTSEGRKSAPGVEWSGSEQHVISLLDRTCDS